jgi:hypothetical protein
MEATLLLTNLLHHPYSKAVKGITNYFYIMIPTEVTFVSAFCFMHFLGTRACLCLLTHITEPFANCPEELILTKCYRPFSRHDPS